MTHWFKAVPMIDTLSFCKKILMTRRASKLLAKFQSLYVTYISLALPVWDSRVTCRVKSSQSQWHAIHEKWWLATSLLLLSRALVSSLFFIIPDSGFRHSDNANYLKLSGRQFQFQWILLCWPWGGEQDCAPALNTFIGSYGCHLRKKCNSILAWLQWIQAEFTLIKTEWCSVYVIQ